MARVVVLTGGGIKGAVAAARYAPQHELILLHVDYGQQAAQAQSRAVSALASTFPSARALSLTFPHILQLQHELGGSDHAGRSTQKSSGVKSPPLTGASKRGLIPMLLMAGVQCGQRVGAALIVVGLSRFCDAVHLGEFGTSGRLDTLCEFVHAFEIMVESASHPGSRIQIEVPLLDLNYPQIVKLARRFEVPLDHTHTCEQPGSRPCRRCPCCQARTAAFSEAAMVDPVTDTKKARV